MSCKKKQAPLFTQLEPDMTGITFVNEVHDSDSFNILDYLYFYNGGGVAVGDINNDGLPDIYFSSNQSSNKLYLNRGDFKFEDITEKAGVQGTGNWNTGVTMADVNGDGYLDIYVCTVGKYRNLHGKNQLFINNGALPGRATPGRNLTFTEKAVEYGLDFEGFNTQATFFDYDKDGDLDMFLVNHSVHSTDSYGKASKRNVPNEVSGDKLLRNDSVPGGRRFTDVTAEAGIYSSIIGYGLNVMVGDMNNDGWEDIYISNDFHEDDYYYINNRNGTFTEMNRQAFGHESRFSMGSDIGDVNNDGWLDIITLDMLPADHKVLKSSAGDDPPDIYQYKLNFGYHHQYSRNCLQLNVGGGEKFSDVALFAGVAATDWSWSPLLADFNNDGTKDLFVSNGIVKRPNDLDYVKYTANETIHKSLQHNHSADKEAIARMPSGKVHNYMFQGTDSLRFIDQSVAWGFEVPTLSNGAAYADLDNDGDLDLIVNNINAPAGIYRNNANELTRNNFLTIQLKGDGQNTFGYGAKVLLKQNGKLQMNYLTASRGFQSGSDQSIHFGVGADTVIDTVEVIWPDHRCQILTDIPVNQKLIVHQKEAAKINPALLPDASSIRSSSMFTDVTDSIDLPYKHAENGFVDFSFQAFIPHQISTQGPKMAVGDVNGDGLDDFYVCGAKYQPGTLFQQTKDGKFIPTNAALFATDLLSEEVNALFFDADGDNDLDLYVVCGGNEFYGEHEQLPDRIYLNDGKGTFTKSNTLPPLYENKSVAIASDVDHDGDMDLFVGGRVVTGRYGEIPHSYLLLNDGKGNFTMADISVAPELQQIGMVTDATWADIDQDGWDDLIIVGEWMPVTIFKNVQGKLANITEQSALQNSTGWWATIKAEDIDKDGDIDLLVGNWGENSKLHASKQFPLKLYVGDLDNNGGLDQILAVEKKGLYYTFLGKDELGKQLPGMIRKKYTSYQAFAGETIEQIFGEALQQTKVLRANTLSSVLLRNDGHEKFTRAKLPAQAQWSPVFAFHTGDFNDDQKTDVMAAGNFYGVLPYEGRYDTSYGCVMLGNGQEDFHTLLPLASGWATEGEVRDIKTIRTTNNKTLIAVARNNNTILFYRKADTPDSLQLSLVE